MQVALLAAGCGTPERNVPTSTAALTAGFPRELTSREPESSGSGPINTSAPPGAHAKYYGGRVVSNIQVVQVLYGAGSVPRRRRAPPGGRTVGTFYQGVLNSPYVDWLTEYNTNTQPGLAHRPDHRPRDVLRAGDITPAAANNGSDHHRRPDPGGAVRADRGRDAPRPDPRRRRQQQHLLRDLLPARQDHHPAAAPLVLGLLRLSRHDRQRRRRRRDLLRRPPRHSGRLGLRVGVRRRAHGLRQLHPRSRRTSWSRPSPTPRSAWRPPSLRRSPGTTSSPTARSATCATARRHRRRQRRRDVHVQKEFSNSANDCIVTRPVRERLLDLGQPDERLGHVPAPRGARRSRRRPSPVARRPSR